MDFFEIGIVSRPQGILGELKLSLYTQNEFRLASGCTLYLEKDGNMCPCEIISSRITGQTAIVRLSGIDDRNAAELLRGTTVCCVRTEADALPTGEYYICDLIGLKVFNDNGDRLGVLRDVLQYGSADIYVVKGERNFSFPALSKVIKCVDVDGSSIVLDADELSRVCVYED